MINNNLSIFGLAFIVLFNTSCTTVEPELHETSVFTKNDGTEIKYYGDFLNSTWRVKCTGTNCTGEYFMFLREDKKIGHSFSSDSQLNFSKDPANWHIQDNLLIVDWDNGDQETYLIDDSNRREIYGENRDGIETYMYKLD